ncbi:MAG: copper amine oxidase N-terminal domain-containing protein [Defluviitaleaceae bacterium]|nr:copper amine oxidase N-terminal domain-containing protein [Defluviitaleaceae bacterium]MCL2262245.1 copper amine oxidase N-terminal domain-containing protein [Defluviitaleaceae bacterium]
MKGFTLRKRALAMVLAAMMAITMLPGVATADGYYLAGAPADYYLEVAEDYADDDVRLLFDEDAVVPMADVVAPLSDAPVLFDLRAHLTANAGATFASLSDLPNGLSIILSTDEEAAGSAAAATIRSEAAVQGGFISVTGRVANATGITIVGVEEGDVIELIMLQADNIASPLVQDNAWGPRFDLWFMTETGQLPVGNDLADGWDSTFTAGIQSFTGHTRLHDASFHQAITQGFGETGATVGAFSPLPSRVIPTDMGAPILNNDWVPVGAFFPWDPQTPYGSAVNDTGYAVPVLRVPAGADRARIVTNRGAHGNIDGSAATLEQVWGAAQQPNILIYSLIIRGTRGDAMTAEEAAALLAEVETDLVAAIAAQATGGYLPFGTTAATALGWLTAALTAPVTISADTLSVAGNELSGGFTLSIAANLIEGATEPATRAVTLTAFPIEQLTGQALVDHVAAVVEAFLASAAFNGAAMTSPADVVAAVNAYLEANPAYADVVASAEGLVVTPPIHGTEDAPYGTDGTISGAIVLTAGTYSATATVSLSFPATPYVADPSIIWRLNINAELVAALNARDGAGAFGVESSGVDGPNTHPKFELVSGGLRVYDRMNSYHGIDVLLYPLGLSEDGEYSMTVIGTTEARFQVEFPLCGTGDDWDTGDVTGTATGVEITFDGTVPVLESGATQTEADGGHRIRIRTDCGWVSGGALRAEFTITSVVIRSLGEGDGGDEDTPGIEVPGSGYLCEACSDFGCPLCRRATGGTGGGTTTRPGSGGGGVFGGARGAVTPIARPVQPQQPAQQPVQVPAAANVVVTADAGESSVSASASDLQAAVSGAAAVEFVMDNATVVIPPGALAAMIAQGGDSFDVSVAVTATATGASVVFSVASGDVAIATFTAPVTVSVTLEDVAVSNGARVVAIDASGAFIGGNYNAATGAFSFQTTAAGTYTVSYMPNLRRVIVQIGSPVISDLAGNAPTQTMDVAPVIEGGRTLLPVRFMAYALGATVGWNDATREVSLTLADGQSLTFAIGTAAPGMDVPAQIIDGRTMVPLRFISEFFGAQVDWNDATRTIEVFKA